MRSETTASACGNRLFRQDVKEASRGTGFYGVEIALDGLAGADSVTIRFADSHEPITREPIALGPVRSLLTSELPDAFRRLLEVVKRKLLGLVIGGSPSWIS